MIEKINQEIKELEREKEIDEKIFENDKSNELGAIQLSKTEAILEQAKKDKKIIEEGLEELKQRIIDIDKPLDRDTYLKNILREIQKLKNQNG